MPLYSVGEYFLTASQNITPGSADAHADLISLSQIFLAFTFFFISTFSLLNESSKSVSFSTAFMKSSVIFTEILAKFTFDLSRSFFTSINSSMSGWLTSIVIMRAPRLPAWPIVPVVVESRSINDTAPVE